jgi:hypothetical protein
VQRRYFPHLTTVKSATLGKPKHHNSGDIINRCLPFLMPMTSLLMGPLLTGCALKKQCAEGFTNGPRYVVDPYWPKPLTNNWILDQVAGIATDRNDNIWLIHRPGSISEDECGAALTPRRSKCCTGLPKLPGRKTIIQTPPLTFDRQAIWRRKG